MGQAVEVHLEGAVETTVAVNLRLGAPTTRSPVLRRLRPGAVVPVVSLAVGEPVHGNPHWYRTNDDAFLWAGGCELLSNGSLATVAHGNGATAVPALQLKRPLVVDMSHGDGVVSFEDARASGLIGVIHKATTGASGRDDAYHDRRDAAESAGLLWGAYHWGTAADPTEQAKNFLDWAKPTDKTLVALDFEKTAGNQMTLEGARKFCEHIFEALKRRPVIYSGDTLKSALGVTKDPFFGAHRLWLAQYGNKPTVQRSWQKYWLWQYTDGQFGPEPRTVPGLPGDRRGRLDCDHFDGDADALKTEWAQ